MPEGRSLDGSGSAARGSGLRPGREAARRIRAARCRSSLVRCQLCVDQFRVSVGRFPAADPPGLSCGFLWVGGEKAPGVGASKKTEETLMELITAYDLDELTLDELYALYHRLHRLLAQTAPESRNCRVWRSRGRPDRETCRLLGLITKKSPAFAGPFP